MKMPNTKMSRAAGAAAVAVVLLGASVLAVAKRPGHAGQAGQGHGLTKFPGFPVPEVIGPPNPQAVVPGSATFALRVFGANYISSSVVNWNRQPRATTVISGHEVDAQILASDVAQPASGIITVTNTTPGGTVTSSSYNFVEVHIPTATFVLGSERNYFPTGVVLAAGDLNGDGRLDLATAPLGGASQIKTFLGNADGSFTPGKAATFSYEGSGPAAFADFNGDGNLDLLFTTGPAHGLPPIRLAVNLGNGNDTFRHGFHLGNFGSPPPCCAAIGDFNQDGVLDVLVQNGHRGFFLFLGNGDGSFRGGGPVGVAGAAGLSVVAGDFNGDGKLDLAAEIALQNPTRTEIVILLGNGDGTFQPARRIATIRNSISDTKLIATDLNGDGNLDIIYTDSGHFGVLIGQGDGTFQPAGFDSPPGTVAFAITGDFNSDGKTDLIFDDFASNSLELLLGNGDGSFQTVQTITLGEAFSGLALGDFNSDGLLDLAGGASKGLGVLLQK